MPELDDELRRIADQGAAGAWPMPAAEVMRRGSRRRHARIIRDVAMAAAVVVLVAAGVLAFRAATTPVRPAPPATHPAVQTPAPSPARPLTPTPEPAPTPSPTRGNRATGRHSAGAGASGIPAGRPPQPSLSAGAGS